MSWADLSQEDAAEGDATSGSDGYIATPAETAAAASDPDLAVPVDTELAPVATAVPASSDTTDTTTVTETTDSVPAPPALLP
jgi:hypothetical protein